MGKVVGFYKKNGKTRPITKSSKKQQYHGQTKAPYWKKSSLSDLKAKPYTEPRYDTREEAEAARRRTPHSEEFHVVKIEHAKKKKWRLFHRKQMMIL